MNFDANSHSTSNSKKLTVAKLHFQAIASLKRFYSQLPLRGKISFPFVSIFLGVWLLGTISLGIHTSRSLERRTRHENNAIATLILREFQQQRQKLRWDAKLLAEKTTIREAVEQEDSFKLLQELIPLKTSLSINFLAVFNSKNDILTNLKSKNLNEINLNDQKTRIQTLSGLSFVSILASEDSSSSLLIGTSPIASHQGTIGGIIVGSEVNDELLKQIVLGTRQHLVAFEREHLIASTLKDKDEEKIPIPIPQLGESTVKIRDRHYFANTSILSGLKDADFKLMVLNPLDSLKRAQYKLWLGIIAISVVGGGIAIAMGNWVAGKIVWRIDKLTRATRKLARGDLTTRLSIASADEIGQLAADFNVMAEKLVSREERLNSQMQQLEETLERLRMTQTQLVQSEKMSGLGQMVAGIAHEINNPVNFIHGNLGYTAQYTQDLLALVKLYEQFYPQPVPEIHEHLEQIELGFLAEDLPKLLASMQIGTNRIRDIVIGLRNFSHLDESELKEVEIHTGLESTLLVIQHRFKGRSERPNIEIIKEYGCYPLKLKCYAGQLNQVFLNLLVNAIDALETVTLNPQITIRSSVAEKSVKISISDNGIGIPEAIRKKIFDPFFTTKVVGKGTGLGLAIVYQIMEQHQGKIECLSCVGKGTEFIIELPLQ